MDEREAKITILLALLVPEATLVTSGRQGVATWSKILAVRESGVASAASAPPGLTFGRQTQKCGPSIAQQ